MNVYGSLVSLNPRILSVTFYWQYLNDIVGFKYVHKFIHVYIAKLLLNGDSYSIHAVEYLFRYSFR
jgi:hypothetical protein